MTAGFLACLVVLALVAGNGAAKEKKEESGSEKLSNDSPRTVGAVQAPDEFYPVPFQSSPPSGAGNPLAAAPFLPQSVGALPGAGPLPGGHFNVPQANVIPFVDQYARGNQFQVPGLALSNLPDGQVKVPGLHQLFSFQGRGKSQNGGNAAVPYQDLGVYAPAAAEGEGRGHELKMSGPYPGSPGFPGGYPGRPGFPGGYPGSPGFPGGYPGGAPTPGGRVPPVPERPVGGYDNLNSAPSSSWPPKVGFVQPGQGFLGQQMVQTPRGRGSADYLSAALRIAEAQRNYELLHPRQPATDEYDQYTDSGLLPPQYFSGPSANSYGQPEAALPPDAQTLPQVPQGGQGYYPQAPSSASGAGAQAGFPGYPREFPYPQASSYPQPGNPQRRDHNPNKKLDENLLGSLLEQVQNLQAVVYSRTDCPRCRPVEQLLERKYSLPTTVFELDRLPKGRELLQFLSEITGVTDVPQVFICGYYIGGAEEVMSYDRLAQLSKFVSKCGDVKLPRN